MFVLPTLSHSDLDFTLGEGNAEVPDQELRDGEIADRVDTTIAVYHASSRRERRIGKMRADC
jgi:hypothetical protein